MAENPNPNGPAGESEHVPTGDGQEGQNGPESGQEDPEGTEGQEGGQEGQEDGQEGQELDDPVKLREELKAARAEAAKYRVKARETAEALKAAKTPEEFQAVADKVAELETDLHRERLARKFNLPPVLAARISGADDDAREADAKALAEAFHGKGGGVGKGGLDPSAKPVSNDPAELAASIPRARR
ncbi:head scaffolding protein [Streptomyces phage Attoomi]|uniref:Scaffolding protein n=1 Tax=Streptomyces phage Attoomi TaxID=2059881 RepID=A0A2H5BLC4_9CAUD|nr:head scaffolding protein [Streptomyces phage Attoomi]AUG87138.1 scaffolding protein [Streptomyces phage Attoomi]